MWLCNSSIGRKVIMSVTGIALILFLTFHGCMNVVALISEDGYNTICELLGANWYAVAATAVLAALVALHFVYALIPDAAKPPCPRRLRYAVTNRPEKVEWASQNMFVLGLIVVLGLLLHLYNFWYNMMFAELVGAMPDIDPADGYGWIVYTFSNPVLAVIYLIWLAALWFHLTHGFWSAPAKPWAGAEKIWFNRWKVIGKWYTTILILLFVVVVLKFALCGGAC